jgi:hypothetical protein
MTTDLHDTDVDRSPAWTAARRHVTERRDFASHLVVYVVVNLAFVFIWAATGAGYFWPAWLMGCWAIGLVLHGWETFIHRPVTDADVEAELERQRGR